MGVSFNNNINEKAINFSSDSLLSNISNWIISSGTGQISDTIILNSMSSCTLELNSPLEMQQVKYLKILADITCEDTSISTDNEHYLSVCCNIRLKDTNNNISDTVELFYPKFSFEELRDENIISNYSIIATDDKIIESIQITIYNNYTDLAVSITNTGLYYSLSPVDGNYLNDYLNSEQYLDSLFSDYVSGLESGKYQLVIPLVNELPDINSVPDGFICRVRNIT